MGGRPWTIAELDAMYAEVEKLVHEGESISVACQKLGYYPTFMNNSHLIEKKKVLIELHRLRRWKNPKKVITGDYFIPQKSPYKPIYYPTIREDNYLV